MRRILWHRLLFSTVIGLALSVFVLTAALANSIGFTSGTTGSLSWSVTNNARVLTISGNGPMPDYSYASGRYADLTECMPWYHAMGYVYTLNIREGVSSVGTYAFYASSGISSVKLPKTITKIGDSAFYSLSTVEFSGKAPEIAYGALGRGNITAYYRPGDSWNGKLQNYGANIVWVKVGGSCGQSAKWELSDENILTISGTGKVSNADWNDYRSDIQGIVIGPGITEIDSRAFVDLTNVTNITFKCNVPNIASDAFEGINAYVTYPACNPDWNDLTVRGNYGGTLIWAPSTINSHSPIEVSAIEPTCMANGMTAGTKCANCDAILSGCVTIQPLGHALEHHEAQAVSCEMIGWNAYDTCTRCGFSTYQMIPATGHKCVIVEAIPATCTDDGRLASSYCETCGYVFVEATIIPALGHSLVVDPGYAPTTTYSGLSDGSHCSVCGVIIDEQTILPRIDDGLQYCFNQDTKTCSVNGYTGNTTSLVLPSYVEGCRVISVDAESFAGNSTLASIKLPTSITSIGYHAFADCKNLSLISFDGEAPTIDSQAFANVTATVSYYPTDSWENIVSSNFGGALTWEKILQIARSGSYGSNIQWELYNDGTLRLSGSGPMLDQSMSFNCPWSDHLLDRVGYYDGVRKEIPVSKPAIKTVVVEDGITHVGAYTFMYGQYIQKIILSESVTSIGESAFEECTAISGIQLPRGVTVLPSRCFEKWYSLTSYTVPDHITTLGMHCFFYCKNLESVTLSDSVTSIGQRAFYQCEHLSTVTIPSSVQSISDDAFMLCNALESVLVECGSYAHQYCIENELPYAITGHPQTKVIDGTDTTCTETGLTEGSYCDVCQAVLVEQEIIPAKGHTVVIDEAVPATCTETGLTEGSHCDVCQAVLVEQEIIPAKGHTVVIDEAVPATCTELGLTEGSHCDVCQAVLVEQEIIPAKGHVAVTDETVPVTCTEPGLTEGSHCDVCHVVLVEQEITPARGHTVVTEETVPATCTEAGLTEGSYCNVCYAVLVEQEIIPALGHSYESFICIHCGDINITPEKCEMQLPKALHQIEDEAFMGATFESVNLPDGVATIGSRAFAYCPNLRFVCLPAGVIIANDAFDNCTNEVKLIYR